jgi:hypothetical protein
MRHRNFVLSSVLVLVAVIAIPAFSAPPERGGLTTGAGSPFIRPVAGSGVHYFTTAIVHGSEPTETGFIQRSTETVDLEGDLVGRLLYQPVSVFDFANGTLVNTGHQVFSGTILGSAPTLLYDDAFRFEVDLGTGATIGEVHLDEDLAGPDIRCHLTIIGTGMTPAGNATFDYSGECRFKRRDLAAECAR